MRSTCILTQTTAVVDRYQKAQKLYDTMTRHYCYVFRGTLSPFDEDWRPEKHATVLRNDKELIEKFEAFKLVEEDQCKSKFVHPLSLLIKAIRSVSASRRRRGLSKFIRQEEKQEGQINGKVNWAGVNFAPWMHRLVSGN